MAGEGFEPSKAEPGDLQSPPIGCSALQVFIFGSLLITSEVCSFTQLLDTQNSYGLEMKLLWESVSLNEQIDYLDRHLLLNGPA